MAAGLAGLAIGGRVTGTLAIGVAGVGLGFVVPTTNLIVARLTPDRAAAALGGLNLCWGIGAATWPVVVARFNPTPGIRVALLLVSVLLLAMAARMATARFPLHVLRQAAGAAPGTRSWPRLAIFGLCIAIYSGVESAFGGWIAEYHASIDCRHFDHAMGDGRLGVLGRAGRRARPGGRRVGAAVRERGPLLGARARRRGDCDAARRVGAVAGHCRCGGLRARPGAFVPRDDGGALSRNPPKVAQPMIALGSAGAATVPWLVGAISSRTGSLSSGLSALLALLAVLVGLHLLRVTQVAREPD